MKKLLLFLTVLCCLAGCGKYTKEDIIKNFSKNVNNSNGYHITGNLEIYRDEELYTYTVDSSYQKEDKFRVSLTNQTNNHEQIILKNEDGVFVVTPSLNKSFKFQSDWPYNNSQIYLLQPIVRDIKNDDILLFEDTKDGYILTVKVKYDNDTKLDKQKIYLDKDLNLTKVEVLDNKDNIKMRMNILEYNLKEDFDDDYFKLNDSYNEDTNNKKEPKKENNENNNEISNNENNSQNNENSNNEPTEEQPQSKIEDIVYPMYLPLNTYLSNQDKVSTEAGERVIMTFSGDKPFLLVQETAQINNTTDYIAGDPYLILDTIGAVTDYSVSWINNGIEYSVVSDTLKIDELISVAESISPKVVGK